MGKTLPYEHLEVGASEKSIQNILANIELLKSIEISFFAAIEVRAFTKTTR
jgi:hypothetical protein